MFYAIWYLSHPLTTRQNFTEPPPSGVNRKRCSQI